MALASDTETAPANAPPSGVIVGVLTVFFLELLPLVDVEVVERLVAVESMFVDVVAVAVALVSAVDNRRWTNR